MDNISRVLFPVISRIQHDREKIGRVIDRILYFQTLILAPTLVAMALFMEKLVFIIPKYAKWAPALPLFYIFCLSALFSSFSSPFMNLFNALGKVRISFSFMLIWTVATWILTPLFTRLFGYYGFPLVLLSIAVSSLFVSHRAKKLAPFHFGRSVYKALIGAPLMGLVMLLLLRLVPSVYAGMAVAGIMGALSYVVILKTVFKVDMVKELRALFENKLCTP
jgi:O-antigen/teichoic acid export membrane protein